VDSCEKNAAWLCKDNALHHSATTLITDKQKQQKSATNKNRPTKISQPDLVNKLDKSKSANKSHQQKISQRQNRPTAKIGHQQKSASNKNQPNKLGDQTCQVKNQPPTKISQQQKSANQTW